MDMGLGRNRVLDSIEQTSGLIAERVADGRLSQAQIAKLDSGFDMDFEEWIAAQEHKSLAVADGRLTTDEGMTVYRILGSDPGEFNAATVAQKVVVTKLLVELLKPLCAV